MINTEISQQAEKIPGLVSMPEISAETLVEALYRLPPEYLPHILQYIEFLEYKFPLTSSDPSEDEALWDDVQAERTEQKAIAGKSARTGFQALTAAKPNAPTMKRKSLPQAGRARKLQHQSPLLK